MLGLGHCLSIHITEPGEARSTHRDNQVITVIFLFFFFFFYQFPQNSRIRLICFPLQECGKFHLSKRPFNEIVLTIAVVFFFKADVLTDFLNEHKTNLNYFN